MQGRKFRYRFPCCVQIQSLEVVPFKIRMSFLLKEPMLHKVEETLDEVIKMKYSKTRTDIGHASLVLSNNVKRN